MAAILAAADAYAGRGLRQLWLLTAVGVRTVPFTLAMDKKEIILFKTLNI